MKFDWLRLRLKNSLEHYKTFRRLRKYTRRKEDNDFKKIMLLQFVGVFIHATNPYFWGKVITSINAQDFNLATIWIIASCTLKPLTDHFNYYRRVVSDRISSKIRRNIVEKFYEKFFAKSVGEHVQEGTHLTAEHIRKGEHYALSMEEMVLSEGYGIFIDFFCVIIFLFAIVPLAGLMMLGIVVINIVWNLFINSRVFTVFTPIEKKWRQLDSFLQERVENVVLVKNNAQELNTISEYQKKFEKVFEEDHGFWKLHYKSIRLRDFINAVLWLLVLIYGLDLAMKGSIPLGTLIPLIWWSQAIMDKVWRMTEMEARMCRTMAVVKQSLDELEKPPVIIDDGKYLPTRGVEKIKFVDVSFHYQDGLHTISNFNLEVQRGDRIALIGPSGAGKTTLMSLLLRHYDPLGGEILIDGISLKELSLKSWRRLVGIVPQQVNLLDGSIFDNIIFGLPEGINDRDKISSIAQDCQIMEFGERLIYGLDTRVGEDGIQLSGGQRQRVAWATAIAKDPAVLIIDEGTSNLDAITEEQLLKNLNLFCNNRISFIIAHRLATIKTCNLLVVLRPAADSIDEPQVEVIAKSFDECRQKSPTFRAMLAQQGLIFSPHCLNCKEIKIEPRISELNVQ